VPDSRRFKYVKNHLFGGSFGFFIDSSGDSEVIHEYMIIYTNILGIETSLIIAIESTYIN
jgi:hypothetical protein